MGKIAFSPTELAQIPDGSMARVEVTARSSSTSYSIDTYTNSTPVLSGDYTLSPAYSTEKHENISSSIQGNTLTVKLGSGINRKIRNHAYIITPSGGAEEISFESRYLGTDGSLASNDGAKFSYNLTENGVYLVEVLYDTGFAAYLAPIQNGKVLSILPNVYDLASKDMTTNIPWETTQMLASINAIRAKKNLPALVLDAELSRLALFKAKDMADNGYVGHTDSQ
ncbi:MAG: CAP domain-containing protein [Patescibacteria group bacterium]